MGSKANVCFLKGETCMKEVNDPRANLRPRPASSSHGTDLFGLKGKKEIMARKQERLTGDKQTFVKYK